MRAIEVVARALAKAEYRAQHGDYNGEREVAWVSNHWQPHENAARGVLRGLKDQPPHVTDAGLGCSWRDALNEMLEAMARA